MWSNNPRSVFWDVLSSDLIHLSRHEVRHSGMRWTRQARDCFELRVDFEVECGWVMELVSGTCVALANSKVRRQAELDARRTRMVGSLPSRNWCSGIYIYIHQEVVFGRWFFVSAFVLSYLEGVYGCTTSFALSSFYNAFRLASFHCWICSWDPSNGKADSHQRSPQW